MARFEVRLSKLEQELHNMMGRRKTLLRMISIQRVLVRHGLDDIITATHFLRPLRFLFLPVP